MNKTQYRTLRRFARDNGNAYALRYAEQVTGNPFAAMYFRWSITDAEIIDPLIQRQSEAKHGTSKVNAIKLWPIS